MLENSLKSLRALIRIITISFVPAWIVVSYFICSVTNMSLTSEIIMSILCGIFAFGYLMIKNLAELRSLENYLGALQNRQFADALTHGRSYYGIKRNGLSGVAGNGITIYDEQAISNDIAAYSNI